MSYTPPDENRRIDITVHNRNRAGFAYQLGRVFGVLIGAALGFIALLLVLIVLVGIIYFIGSIS